MGSHDALPVKRNHRSSAPMTGSARNQLWHVRTSALGGGAATTRIRVLLGPVASDSDNLNRRLTNPLSKPAVARCVALPENVTSAGWQVTLRDPIWPVSC